MFNTLLSLQPVNGRMNYYYSSTDRHMCNSSLTSEKKRHTVFIVNTIEPIDPYRMLLPTFADFLYLSSIYGCSSTST